MDSLFTAFVMGFWGVVYALIGGLLFLKAVQGDITFREAALIFSPLAVCFILMGVTNGTPFFYVFLVASLVWIVWLTMRQTIAEQKVESDIVAEEVEKWSQAVAQDARNVGAHVFLGHAHARGARYDTAAEEYRRALELDATSARDINRYLAMRSNAEAAAVRSRLPELDRVTRELKQRSCYTPRPAPRTVRSRAARRMTGTRRRRNSPPAAASSSATPRKRSTRRNWSGTAASPSCVRHWTTPPTTCPRAWPTPVFWKRSGKRSGRPASTRMR